MKQRNESKLFWITGLSGAGKTAIGRELYELLKVQKISVVYLDGDILRGVFDCKVGYTKEDRLKLGMQYCRLSKMLTDQDVNVVCATISMYPECWQWNRKHIPGYSEIYIRVPIDILIKRDQKLLYSRALNGEINNVMGIDMPVNEPESPDLILDNDGKITPLILAKQILENTQQEKT